MARSPSAEERALWRAAMRDVEPSQPAPPAPAPAPPAPRARTRATEAAVAIPGGGLDRRSAARLRRGEMALGARLDLHGMTQDEAHRALVRFLENSYEAGLRAVLVITGKGGGDGEGVLRRSVPRWLGEARCRKLVLGTSPARPRHGGEGALYVLLRRKRG
jgi:DNA-nicking Smr family endonuclease